MDKTLYESSSGGLINAHDFSDALRSVGVKDHDTIFVHSSILAFGRIVSPGTILQSLVDVIKASVPDGNLLMPTYTYSFTKNEIYDVEKTPSTVGSLTNYFRETPDVYRTMDPIFSVAVLGDKKYLDCDVRDCFGEDSVYSELLESRAKIVMLGSDFSKSLTFLHFIEQQFGVYYRRLKRFQGRKKIGTDVFDDHCLFYVREPKDTVKVCLKRLEKCLSDKGITRKTRVGDGYITSINIRDLYTACTDLLGKDQNFFLTQDIR